MEGRYWRLVGLKLSCGGCVDLNNVVHKKLAVAPLVLNKFRWAVNGQWAVDSSGQAVTVFLFSLAPVTRLVVVGQKIEKSINQSIHQSHIKPVPVKLNQ